MCVHDLDIKISFRNLSPLFLTAVGAEGALQAILCKIFLHIQLKCVCECLLAHVCMKASLHVFPVPR